MTDEERDLATIEALAQFAIDQQKLSARMKADTEPMGCLQTPAVGLLVLIVALASASGLVP